MSSGHHTTVARGESLSNRSFLSPYLYQGAASSKRFAAPVQFQGVPSHVQQPPYLILELVIPRMLLSFKDEAHANDAIDDFNLQTDALVIIFVAFEHGTYKTAMDDTLRVYVYTARSV